MCMGVSGPFAFVVLHSCNGVGLGIKIKDSARFKRRWIVSMVVAIASTPGRTWLLGPIKHTLSANAKMRIEK